MALASGTGLPTGAAAQAARPFGTAPTRPQAVGAPALIGRPMAGIDLTSAARLAGARTYRVLRKGQVAPMDMRADRLTIILDDAGVIVDAYRG